MQKRKRIFSLIAAVGIVCTIIYGCKKSFIDRRPIGQYTIETYFTTEERAFQGVVGVYDVMGWSRTFDKMFWSLGDGGSDDTPIGLNRDDGSPPYVGINPVVDYTNVSAAKLSPAMENLYKGFYEGIYRANVVIDALQKSTIDKAKSDRFLAEVKTLRAIYYFMLVNYYGGVPLYTTPINPGDESSVTLGRATVRDVYDLIEKDLTESVANLPTKAQTAAENMLGRLTRGAALTLLTKAYLFDKKYAEAASTAQQIINSGEYALDDYYANFVQSTTNGVESIWEIMRAENYTDNGGGWGADSFDGTGTPVAVACGGWGQNSPSGDLFQQYETGDIRRRYTTTLETDTLQGVQMCGTPEAPGMAKHVIPGKKEGDFPRSDIIALNWVLFRYADVLLMRAEALAAGAGADSPAPTDAVNLLVQVRSRAGLTDPTSADFQGYTSEELLRFIRNERRREFGMEAWRLFDLRRWGADSTKNALMRVGKINETDRPWNDAYLLYPFPQSEIELSKNAIVQNPGY